MTLTSETTVADLVIDNPAAAKVLEAHGIDYCCGGRQPAPEALAEHGLSLDQFNRELTAAAISESEPQPDWAHQPLVTLVDYIEQRHHTYLKRELPRVAGLMAKVLEAHREHHGGTLAPLSEILLDLKAELESHLMKEEMILFPAVRQRDHGMWGPGSLRGPVTVMEHEHDSAGDALRRMHELTNGYQTPSDGCLTYRELMRSLAELEKDLHMHIHLENNILFPRALRLE